jgi:HupE/UreJ protein
VRRVVVALVVLWAGVAEAHKPSDAHLRLAVDGTTLAGQVSIAIRDLDGAVDVDADGNGDITWAETAAAAPRIAAYVKDRIALDSGGPCALALGTPALLDLTDGAYWTAPVTATCPSRPGTLTLTYKLLFDIDAQHNGIIHLQAPGFAKTIVVHNANPVAIDIDDPTATMAVLREGGRALPLEPLLALLLLILPLRKARATDVAMLAGTFAIAEAASLVLVSSGALDLPATWTLPVIAGSLVALGIANLLGLGRDRGALALELGAVHGFALAHAFDALALPSRGLPVVLAFAAGCVLAQGAITTALAGALSMLRRRAPDRSIVMYASAAATLAAVYLVVHHIAV